MLDREEEAILWPHIEAALRDRTIGATNEILNRLKEIKREQ